MKNVAISNALHSLITGVSLAMLSAPGKGIAGIKAGSKRLTFIYCFVAVAALWAVGLFFAYQELLSWEGLPRSTVVATMCIILCMITLLSMFPAAVYAAFTWRERARALQYTRLELRHHNLGYLEKDADECFDTVYKAESYRVPVPLATLAMLIGWGMVFFSGGPDIVAELAKSGNIANFLDDLGNAHPIIFGFLGAFFFSLRILFHRYVTIDLKAAVFMHIAVRVWVVMVLTLVLSVVWYTIPAPVDSLYWGGPALPAICFIAGITPDVALDLIQKAARGFIGSRRHGSFYGHVPLDRIQGLNVWHQARLTEEGIDSVQNLAMSDIVGLIVHTRLGVMRLLHWVDQALLIICVRDDLESFRRAHICTATSFEAIYMGLPQRQQKEEESQCEAKLRSRMEHEGRMYIPPVPPILTETLGGGRELENRIRNAMIAVCNDGSFQRLRQIRLAQSTNVAGVESPSSTA